MSDKAIVLKPREAIHNVFEGLDGAVKETVFAALEFFGKEKSESGNKIEDLVKVNKLKTAYNTLISALVENRLNDLNKYQRLFLATGAIGDSVETNTGVVNLLDLTVYNSLLNSFENKDEDNPFDSFVFSVPEKYKALAKGELELIDTSGKKKRNTTTKVDTKKVKANLEWKKNDSLRTGANFIREMGNDLDNKILPLADGVKIKNIKLNYDIVKKYLEILQKGHRITPDEKKLKDTLKLPVETMSKGMLEFFTSNAEAFTKLSTQMAGLKEKIEDIVQKEIEIGKVDTIVSETEAKTFTKFDTETIDIVKKDISILNGFIVTAAEKAANRVPFSGARILLNSQIPDVTKSENFLCTPEAVLKSLNKIAEIHVNLFPKDEEGNYIIPPILIEPIRNYCDFLEDRFVIGFVSGEAAKVGAKVGFSPVDMQVLKVMGMYLAKDPVYNYRGELNEGTFMGDYTGKVEKTAQVKWTGADKKMNMVMSSELVDAASRDDAVNDYIDFLFNTENGFGPSQKMSKRRVVIMLRYCTIKSIENNVRLLLNYVAQSEPIEVRDTILKYTNRNHDAAKEMVRKLLKEDAGLQRTLGVNADYVISKIFV